MSTRISFGTLLENVGFDATTGRLNLDDASLMENASADAFGVLPPIAKLNPEQAIHPYALRNET